MSTLTLLVWHTQIHTLWRKDASLHSPLFYTLFSGPSGNHARGLHSPEAFGTSEKRTRMLTPLQTPRRLCKSKTFLHNFQKVQRPGVSAKPASPLWQRCHRFNITYLLYAVHIVSQPCSSTTCILHTCFTYQSSGRKLRSTDARNAAVFCSDRKILFSRSTAFLFGGCTCQNLLFRSYRKEAGTPLDCCLHLITPCRLII